jgi:uncharacterized protein (PEP-CTERM system associated)
MSRPKHLTRHAVSGLPLSAAVAALVAGLAGVAPARAEGLVVTPSVSLVETLTSNRDLDSTDAQADLITRISPSLFVRSGSGALRGSLSYTLNGVIYARDSGSNSAFHTLSGSGELEFVPNRAGMTVSAGASRQAISAFGTQSTDESLNGANQAQTFRYSLSPYLKGRLLGNVTYVAQLAYNDSRSDADIDTDTRSVNALVGLSGRLGALGWGLDASRLVSETAQQPRVHNGRIGGSLNYLADVDLQLALRAGYEVDDLRTGESESTATWGAGLVWTPTVRTSVNLDFDRRFFGRSYSVRFSHRMARTIWTFNDSRSLTVPGVTGRGVLSLYDLFFAQFASIEPDVTRRDVLVRDFLAANGLNGADTIVLPGFLATGPTVQRSQTATMAYNGRRTTFTVTALQTRSTSASDTAAAGSDLADGRNVRQQGLTFNLSHRLTPDDSIVFTLSKRRTLGSGSQAATDLSSIVATWSARLGRYTNVSLGVRHSYFASETNPYHESALTGSVRMRF